MIKHKKWEVFTSHFLCGVLFHVKFYSQASVTTVVRYKFTSAHVFDTPSAPLCNASHALFKALILSEASKSSALISPEIVYESPLTL